MYLIEGVKTVKEALSAGADIQTVAVCGGVKEVDDGMSECNVVVLEENLFKNLTDTRTSQGMLAVSRKKEYALSDLEQVLGTDGGNIVVLDRLQDPGNMGTIIRTAEAAGYRAVLIMPGCADIYSPKVARAAAGSLFRMPIIHGDTCENVIGELRHLGKKIAVTSLDADTFYYETDLSEDTVLVIGNEGRGVSADFMELSDIKIKIPMRGSIESLNAAVAAGILMYQSYGKNK